MGLMQGSAAQCSLQCNEIPWRWGWARSGLGVRMCVRDPRHRNRVQLETCAAERHPWGHVSLEEVCAAGCAVQEGGRAVGKVCSGEHAAIADVPCCRAARIRTPPRPQRLWASSLLVPATQHGAGCGVQGCEGVGSRGRWSRVRWSRERTPSPLLRISVRNVRGGAWPWLWAAHRVRCP